MNGPSTSRDRGCGRWIKCDVVVVVTVVLVVGVRTTAKGAAEEDVTIIFYASDAYV